MTIEGTLAEILERVRRIEEWQQLQSNDRAAPDENERGGIRALAMWIGTTPAGAKALAHRDASLAALASRRGSVRVWTRHDVERWLDDRRARSAPRLRVAG